MKIFNLALILFIFFQNTSLFSQSEPINQYNASGKKDGLWSKPINENLCPTDSSNYTYIGLERYVNGHLINSFDCANAKKKLRLFFFQIQITINLIN